MSRADAVVAALRDNLAGLEIDGRCVQIAAFALAVMAWRIGGAGVKLPPPHVAWVGGPPPLPRVEFAALANGDVELRRGLEALHDLFSQAPLLGSLIQPLGGELASAGRIARIEGQMSALVESMRAAEPDRIEGGLAARGMSEAAAILSRRYVLLATNVPYLGRGKQDPVLADHVAREMPAARSDLATAMLQRMLSLAADYGSIASVTPQNWLFLSGFTKFRLNILRVAQLDMVINLGEEAWEEFGQRGPRPL